ncbi:rod shape-determining protein MreC [Staphylococcus massiliensis]|uniref:rod shape-determining protein MreC n=1 Tax=Staphylococcus massiliensis TaxID=555791 RepID=UPI001EDFFCF2|nr:rod shape-determining protein MreC [Staphylococcus massiliensis]MCG3399090.1 rod shape-determining protein MreC [Staphylococcus massiliensis]
MSNFLKNNKFIVFLCGLILFISLIGLSIRSQHQSPVEQYAGDTVSFGQRAFTYPAHIVTGAIGDLFNFKDEQPEADDKVKQLEAENQRLEAENKKYEKELDIKDISKYEPISATVLARNPDQWMNRIVIDKGEKAGIDSNMAVMTASGLVGRISKVNQYSSQVEMITTKSRAGKLSVNIQHEDDNVFGLIDHYEEESNELVISDIDNSKKIKEGDKVVTSGLADQLPKGLFIGEVTKVENDQYGLSKQVRVKPAATMKDLNHVYIAKRDPKSIPSEEERGE